jgi:REP element-mobilizing transposase RayT
MARRIRLDGAAVAHHVMIRGLEGRSIFCDGGDRQDFVDRLCRLFPECGARCFAWVLMSNHVHLVVQTAAGTLSRVMQRLNTGYAVRFNRLRARRGYLFMDRFRSRVVETDADLIGLIRYVHGNPLEAGLIASLEALATYPWSGHSALVGARPALPFEAVEPTLQLFDENLGRARAELLAWMGRDEEAPVAPAGAAAPGGTVASAPPAAAVPQRERGDLSALLRAVCQHYGLEAHELASGRKTPRIVRARSVVAYVAVIELGQIGRTVAGALGVSRASVSAALDRGRRAVAEDRFTFGAGVPRPGGANLNI